MTSYLVTGATGFIGRHLVERLLRRDGAEVSVLVRAGSQAKLAERCRQWPGGERVAGVVGDVSEPLCGLSAEQQARLRGVDHVVHLAALYDMTADPRHDEESNVAGTRHVVGLAGRLAAGCLHHVSSIAVAGDHRGVFDESMFDVGQRLTSPYHATKFAAEKVVRELSEVPWRVYRPSIVVGHSRTGVMDKVDGPYYFFPTLGRLGGLPRWLPVLAPDLGATNLVPVDYVADAMDALVHADGLDGRAFHLATPGRQRVVDVYNAFARTAGAPQVRVTLDPLLAAPVGVTGSLVGLLPGARAARDLAAQTLGIPPQVLPYLTFPFVFATEATRQALEGVVAPPPALDDYADVLWQFWERSLDPLRARRPRGGGPLAGRRVVITGASSGIGRATALAVAARGGVPLLVARSTDKLEALREQVRTAGGSAYVYSCDLTQGESVDALVKALLADHADTGIDMLVNNAGRSIRRSVRLSLDRFHDYERTMTLNYFGAVRLILGLLPHMIDRRFGHIVNVSSIGVQANPPRFSAYVASKAALDAFSRVVASETFGDGVTFTTVHMPLVRTPMIRPTRIYDAFPAISPDEAAQLVVRALEKRPKHIGTRLGTFAEVSYALAPKLVDAVLHVAYQAFPDSRAAGGTEDMSVGRGAWAMARLLPGVHW